LLQNPRIDRPWKPRIHDSAPLSLAMDKPEWLTSVEAVLEVLNEGVVITNENHRILFANARFVEMTGILKRDLIGFDPTQFYSPQEFDFVAHQIDVEFRHATLLFFLERTEPACPSSTAHGHSRIPAGSLEP
jgi:PAS domain-containing protein